MRRSTHLDATLTGVALQPGFRIGLWRGERSRHAGPPTGVFRARARWIAESPKPSLDRPPRTPTVPS
jgi:hypothetical protein